MQSLLASTTPAARGAKLSRQCHKLYPHSNSVQFTADSVLSPAFPFPPCPPLLHLSHDFTDNFPRLLLEHKLREQHIWIPTGQSTQQRGSIRPRKEALGETLLLGQIYRQDAPDWAESPPETGHTFLHQSKHTAITSHQVKEAFPWLQKGQRKISSDSRESKARQ